MRGNEGCPEFGLSEGIPFESLDCLLTVGREEGIRLGESDGILLTKESVSWLDGATAVGPSLEVDGDVDRAGFPIVGLSPGLESLG